MPEPRLSARAGRSGGPDLVSTARDAAAAGLRYYGRLGRLALDLSEALIPALVDLRRGTDAPAPPAPAAEDAPATILVEAPAGERAVGVFMVENTTGETVAGPVSVSDFSGPARRRARPEVRFSPEVVSLDPGDQVLVQVTAVVDEKLTPGFRYAAEISVPTLSGGRIPIVVRRRPDAARAPEPEAKPKPRRAPRKA